jgi:hypothetical protein
MLGMQFEMIIQKANRDGVSYEVGLFANVPISPEMREIGEKYFGKLRIADHSSSLLPEVDIR